MNEKKREEIEQQADNETQLVKSNQQLHRTIKEKRKELLGIFCVLALGGFLFFRYNTHQVQGQSMEPTFSTADRIFVRKHQLPKRNELVTFFPENKPEDSYLKRVVGLPGDGLILRGTTLYIIPKEAEMPAIAPTEQTPKELPEGAVTVEVTSGIATIVFNYKQIPSNQYFVLGDNLEHSKDSRNFGWIDEQQLEGVVFFRYYPWEKVGTVQ